MSWMKAVGIGGLVVVLGLTAVIPASSAATQSPPLTSDSRPIAGLEAVRSFTAVPVGVMPNPSELLYVAVPPCRVADTRKGGGLVVGGSTRTFHVTGTSGFTPAGGTSGGCGIPAGAAAAAITVTGAGSTGSGFMTLFAQGTPRPNVSQVSFTKGHNVSTPANGPLSAASGSVSLFTSGATHVLLDVSGYYTAPMAAFIDTDGTVVAGTGRVLSSVRLGVGVYQVTFDRSLKNCTSVATPWNYPKYTSSVEAPYFSAPDSAVVRLYDIAGNAAVDHPFYLTVAC